MADTPDLVIDELCGRFAAGWRAGCPDRLEDVVGGAPEAVRAAVFERALAVEKEHREAGGLPLTPDEARDRFGALGPWASEVLDAAFPPPPAVVLEVVGGPHAGRSFPLAGHAVFTVGRLPGQHVCLPDDPYLGRAHCLVEVNPPLARVVDLGSRSGTFVNGRQVPQAELRDGDEVRAGKTVFRVRVPETGGFATLTLSDGRVAIGPHPGGPPAVPGYRLGRELGRGAMGVVYLAAEEATGEEVAIKTLLPAVPPTRVALGRFVREADILRRLSHPGIVAFRAAGAVGPLLYFVMEYVPGPSAAAVLRDGGPVAPGRLLGWARQFLTALAHAHDKGFVHRDVKPGNLLVVGPPGAEVVKVSDFGLARAYEESSMSGLTLVDTPGGTPGFMSPEHVTDFRSVRPAADQYAAGATLYQLLTGKTVYEPAPSTREKLVQILVSEPIPLRPGAPPVPAPFGPVVCRALARDPKARFPDLRAMLAALPAG
jgi:serine/threonine-protein kinase